MMKILRLMVLFFLLFGINFLATKASYGQTSTAATNDFSELASKRMDEIIANGKIIVSNSSVTKEVQLEQMSKLILESFDLNAIGRFLLGVQWRTISPEEKNEFLELLKQITIKSYAARFKDYSTYNYINRGAVMEGKSTLISYDVVRPNKQALKLQWRLIKSGDNYRIVDAIVEGISLAIAQQQEYAAIIERNGNGFNGLLEVLRNREKSISK